MSTQFEIQGLKSSIEGKEILKGIDLEIKGGEVHAIMGPNGTGKSTLASALMGHPKYEVTEGAVTLNGEDVLEMGVDERARAGLFLGHAISERNYGRNELRLPAQRDQRPPRRRQRDFPDQVHPPNGRQDERAGDEPRVHAPLPERRLLRRREETQRNSANDAA